MTLQQAETFVRTNALVVGLGPHFLDNLLAIAEARRLSVADAADLVGLLDEEANWNLGLLHDRANPPDDSGLEVEYLVAAHAATDIGRIASELDDASAES